MSDYQAVNGYVMPNKQYTTQSINQKYLSRSTTDSVDSKVDNLFNKMPELYKQVKQESNFKSSDDAQLFYRGLDKNYEIPALCQYQSMMVKTNFPGPEAIVAEVAAKYGN